MDKETRKRFDFHTEFNDMVHDLQTLFDNEAYWQAEYDCYKDKVSISVKWHLLNGLMDAKKDCDYKLKAIQKHIEGGINNG